MAETKASGNDRLTNISALRAMVGIVSGKGERAMLQLREFRAVCLGYAIVAAYFLAVLLSGYAEPIQIVTLFWLYLQGSLALWLALGLAALLVLLWRERPRRGEQAPSPIAKIRDWFGAQWRSDRLAKALWPPFMLALLIASFNAFKQTILSTRPFSWDPGLAEADRWLFLGEDGWRVLHDWFGSPGATYFIDLTYHGWFVPMSLGVVMCAFFGPGSYRLRTQYLLSYIFAWIGIGSIAAFLMPSAGPCFYNELVGTNAGYAELMRVLAEHDAILAAERGQGLYALGNMQGLLASHGSDQIAIGGGISAMPSVHNALAILFAMAGFRIHRWLGWAMTGYALLIWVGSVYLGWHYALDGIVSAVMLLLFWPLAGRIADALDRPATPAATPALAAS